MRRLLFFTSLLLVACGAEDEGATTFRVDGPTPFAGASGASSGAGHGGIAGGAGASAAGKAGGPGAGAAGQAGAGQGAAGQGGASAGAAGKAGGPGGGAAGKAGGPGAGAAGTAGGPGAGQGGAPYVPPPLPTVPDTSAPPCSAATSGTSLQFLSDACEAKVHPSTADRAFTCPVVDPSATQTLSNGKTVTYQPPGLAVTVESGALAGVVPPELRVTLILVSRVGGVPMIRVLSSGRHAEAYQPWSSSKFMAIANAGATMRQKSSYAVGLSASVKGIPLGDLVTSVHNYDDDPYSSNGLARWFHDIGGRAKANDLLHTWLGRPASETFGGNYGAAAPPLGYSFTSPSGTKLDVVPDATSGPANHFSTFTAAHFLRRLVHHRELSAERLPGLQWEDLEVLFYGAPKSAKGPVGGMSADTTIYLQQYDMPYLEQRSHGQWRNLSKLGMGSDAELVMTGYACYPELDPQGSPVPGRGKELFIATELSSGGAGSGWALYRSRDRILADAHRAILKRVLANQL